MKRIYLKTAVVGSAFLAISVAWGVYNAFVPKFLRGFTESTTLIGFIMTLDNYFAIFVQPAVGNISDRIDTRFGKRMPFLIAGMPLAALFMFFIPHYFSFASLVAFLVLMNLSMSIFRSPAISLMPDIIPESHRSRSNSVVNFMGALGAAAVLLVGSKLWDMDHVYPFYIAGLFVIIPFFILFLLIKEKRDSIDYYRKPEKEAGLKEIVSEVLKIDKKTLLSLLSICFVYMSYQGLESMFTLYATEYLKVSTPTAVRTFLFIAVSFVIFAVPVGILSDKMGKRKSILIGLTGLTVLFFAAAFIKSIIPLRVILFFGGLLWSFVIINIYPFIIDLAPQGKIGTYTGFYYLFTSISAIVSPPLLGLLIDLIGYGILFFYCGLSFLIALILIRFSKADKDTASDNIIKSHVLKNNI